MNLNISGLPVIVILVGFVAVFSTPVWLAARLVGASKPTLLRSALALAVGTVLAATATHLAGGWGLVLVPLAYLLAFRWVLDATLGEAFLLGIAALIFYALMFKLFGASISAVPGSLPVPATGGGAGVV